MSQNREEAVKQEGKEETVKQGIEGINLGGCEKEAVKKY